MKRELFAFILIAVAIIAFPVGVAHTAFTNSTGIAVGWFAVSFFSAIVGCLILD